MHHCYVPEPTHAAHQDLLDEATIRRVGASLVIEAVTVDWAWIDRLRAQGGVDLEVIEAALEPTAMPDHSPGEDLFPR
ncbi:hypothetical protein [Cellulomonas sp. KRMCY2]|uniref:hypothetical protein n=1 Tax=Cellulomonas sp. KRMCY2 TaxID=1304865 RepID=UPI0012DC8012|nr:hypothetical protein [Cellulomonas sp. KRMCY2]